MDFIIAAGIAVLVAIISVLMAVLTKKSKKQFLLYGVVGIIMGMLLGYFLAPLIISFI